MAESQGVGTRATWLVYRKIPKCCKGRFRLFILTPIVGGCSGVNKNRQHDLLIQLPTNLREVHKSIAVFDL
jgi:hypothetical protein